jgi:hypothetical protein
VNELERGTTAIAPIALEVGEWYAAEISLPTDDSLRIIFRERTEGDEIHVTVLPVDAPAPVFRRLKHCAIRYAARLKQVTERRRREIGVLLGAIGESMDERLAGGASIAEILGADRRARRVVFGREMLREMLAPEIVEGAPIASGFVLHDIYPSSQRRLEHAEELSLIIELRRDLRRVLFSVSRASDRPALIRTRNFSMVEIAGGRGELEGVDAVRALLSFVFQLRDHDGLEVVFPSVLDDVALRALPAHVDAPKVNGSLNLALDADCGQQCQFCSVKSGSPAYDGGDGTLARALSDLTDARAKGIHHLRLNGYDPLAFSRVLDVLAGARRLGFDKVEVFSPCTRLADRVFCEALLAELPDDRVFHVPLYAADAAVHDRVVGREGAHALVSRALDNLIELGQRKAVSILSVVTTTNLGHLAALHRWSSERQLSFSAHMPYPMHEATDDPYLTVVPRQTDVAAVAAEVHRARGAGRHDLSIFGVAPCVTHAVFAARGIKPWEWVAAGETALLPGTEYDRDDIEHGGGERANSAFRVSTVNCPHAKYCALVTVCGGAFLRAYVERHGGDEFHPVDLRTLMESR